MTKKIKMELIKGLVALVVAVAASFLSYNLGIDKAEVAATNSNHITISINGEDTSVKPEEYQTIFDELETENSQLAEEIAALKKQNSALELENEALLKENKTLADSQGKDMPEGSVKSEILAFMPDVTPAYENFHYKEYSQRSGKAESFYIAGKQYYNGIVWNAWNTGHSLYSLEGKYTEITGIIGHIDGSDMGEASLQIYFDGALHEEFTLKGDMVAQPFSIDVTGVHQLKLMLSHGRGSYGYADATIH